MTTGTACTCWLEPSHPTVTRLTATPCSGKFWRGQKKDDRKGREIHDKFCKGLLRIYHLSLSGNSLTKMNFEISSEVLKRNLVLYLKILKYIYPFPQQTHFQQSIKRQIQRTPAADGLLRQYPKMCLQVSVTLE